MGSIDHVKQKLLLVQIMLNMEIAHFHKKVLVSGTPLVNYWVQLLIVQNGKELMNIVKNIVICVKVHHNQIMM